MVNFAWIAGSIGFSSENLRDMIKTVEGTKNVNQLLRERFKGGKGGITIIAFGKFTNYPKKSLASN